MLEAFNSQFWHDIVWALLHSIWQAAIIALLLGLVLRQISAKHASLRYWISAAAIVSVVLSSFFTYHVRMQFRSLPTSPVVEQTSSFSSSPSTLSNLPAVALENTTAAASNMEIGINWTALAALFWVIGVSVMVLRTIGAVFNGNHRSSVSPIESSKHLELLKELSHKLGLRRAPSFWSSPTSLTPYAVGFLSPAIVVPISMLTSLNAMELQAVLAHELAHIRRNDYLANLFQMVIEAVYFFNPALWWISRQIRVEREACCDQVAIESSSNRIGYATILANWMESLGDGSETQFAEAPSASLAFSQKQPSSMLERIQRILKPDAKPHSRVSTVNLIFVVAASVLIACLFNAGSKAVTVAAAQVLSTSERIEKIEDKQRAVTVTADGSAKGTTTIRGRITTEDGGKAKSGCIYSSSKNGGTNQASEGRFKANQEFEVSVNSGAVWLKFFSENYAPAIIGPIEAFKDQVVTQNVKLVKGEPHPIHVMDESGLPISGAKVLMYPKSNGGPIWEKTTDEMGKHQYEHRNPGKQSNLKVEKFGYITHWSTVVNGSKTEITLKTAPVTKGSVVSAEGKSVANAEVRLLMVKEKSSQFSSQHDLLATTDQDGRFETPLFSPSGLHDVIVVSDHGMGFAENVAVSDDLKFTLQPECSMDVTIEGDMNRLRRWPNGTLVIGLYQRVLNECWDGSIRDGEVEILDESDEHVQLKLRRLLPGKFSLRSGKFEYALEAKPGDHSIKITTEAGEPSTHGEKAKLHIQFQSNGEIVKPSGKLYLNSVSPLHDGEVTATMYPGNYSLEPDGLIGFTFKSQVIAVKADGENEFVIDVEPAGAVSGRVVDADGAPVSVPVSCRYETRDHGSAGLASSSLKSDSDGNFLLTPIPLGATVIAKAGERFNPAISRELLVDQANTVVDVQLQIEKPESAKVRVVDQQGKPILGVDLSVILYDPSGGSWSGNLSTDVKGECAISPLHPTWGYRVAAAKKGFIAKADELIQGETTVLQLESSNIVRGRVMDKDDKPVSGRRVWAAVVDYNTLRGQRSLFDADRITDAQGQFEFTSLPMTEFYIKTDGAVELVIVDASAESEPLEVQVEELQLQE